MRSFKNKVECVCTVEFGNVDVELVAFFQDAFATFGDEVVEAVGEAGHALAEVVEAEVYGWEGIGH